MLNRSVSGVVEWFIARSEPSHGLWLATVGEGWGRCSFALRECKGSASLRYSVGRLVGEQLETDPQQVGVTRPGRAYGTAELTRCHLERTTGFEPATRTLARCGIRASGAARPAYVDSVRLFVREVPNPPRSNTRYYG